MFVWAPDSDVVIGEYLDVDRVELQADVMAIGRGGVVELRDPISGDLRGEVVALDDDWGLASDGGYVWVADLFGLRVFEVDGTLRWDRAGDYSGASVLPLSDELHVHAPATGLSVEAIDVVTTDVSTIPFDGTFAEWFYDNPRFWTEEGAAYRLYDTDGSLLDFAIGEIRFASGDWVVFGPPADTTVAAIDDLDTVQYSGSNIRFFDGVLIGSAALLAERELVRLWSDVLVPEVVPTPVTSIDWAFSPDGSWIVGGQYGSVFDPDAQPLSGGVVDHFYGSESGRFGVANSASMTHTFDVDPTCAIDPVSTLLRPSRAAALSGDGSRLADMLWDDEVRLWDVETATVEQFWPWSDGPLTRTRFELSHSGDALSLVGQPAATWGWSAALYRSSDAVPQYDDAGVRQPAIAPTGALAAYNEAMSDSYEGSSGYLFDGAALTAIFDGAPIGFLDATTLLVAHYETTPGDCPGPYQLAYHCDTYVESELVDETGAVIAVAPLPDPWSFIRISSTEILLDEGPEVDQLPTIYDVYTGDVLWTGPDANAVAVGPDHVLYRQDNQLVLTKWR